MTPSRKRIGLVTSARADLSICLPLMRAMAQDPELELAVVVTGMHLSAAYGSTIHQIEEAGFAVRERVECLLSSDTPEAIGKSIGLGVIGFAQLFARWRPDILVVVGDRFEMYAAALAALPFTLPLAHVHGGEVTEGAMDDALRHSMTKLSHLHFASTVTYARRIAQLGEEPWRIIVSGAPSLDTLRTTPLLPREELAARYRLRLDQPPLVVTYHPVTLEFERVAWQIEQLLEALETLEVPIVFTLPNADTNSRVIIRLIEAFVREHANARLIENLGTQHYFSMMACAAAMVGNSSSGIIEAPSFGLPVVNIGTRQQGRLRAANVVDVGYSHEDIAQGLAKALAPDFRVRLRHLANPYGNGHAAEAIIKCLKETPLDQRLIQKQFVDLSGAPERWSEPQVAAHAA